MTEQTDQLRARFARVSGLADLRQTDRHPSYLSDQTLAELQAMVRTGHEYVGEPATDLEVDAAVIAGLLVMWSLEMDTQSIEETLA